MGAADGTSRRKSRLSPRLGAPPFSIQLKADRVRAPAGPCLLGHVRLWRGLSHGRANARHGRSFIIVGGRTTTNGPGARCSSMTRTRVCISGARETCSLNATKADLRFRFRQRAHGYRLALPDALAARARPRDRGRERCHARSPAPSRCARRAEQPHGVFGLVARRGLAPFVPAQLR